MLGYLFIANERIVKRTCNKTFERTTLAPIFPFGLDSIQGYLELAEWYHNRGVIFSCGLEQKTTLNSMYSRLSQLEKEGHLLLVWEDQTDYEGQPSLKLKEISLTTSGHKLLAELRAKSKLGKIKERLSTILWAAISSVITTLIVLAIKGK